MINRRLLGTLLSTAEPFYTASRETYNSTSVRNFGNNIFYRPIFKLHPLLYCLQNNGHIWYPTTP